MSNRKRILPIYLIVDASDPMHEEPISAIPSAVSELISSFRKRPEALEMAFLSVIRFGGEAQQLVPLTPLPDFQVPSFWDLTVGGRPILGAALSHLAECQQREVRPGTGDCRWYRPITIILTNGNFCDTFDEIENSMGGLNEGDALITCFFRDDIIIKGFKDDDNICERFPSSEQEIATRYLSNLLFRHRDFYRTFCLPSYVRRALRKDCLSLSDNVTKKRIPFYFLIDASSSMEEGRFDVARDMLSDFLEDVYLYGGQLSDFLRSSFIFYNEHAEQVQTLKEWTGWIPPFSVGGKPNLKDACKLLCACRSKEVSPEDNYLPTAIVITNGLEKAGNVADLHCAIAHVRSQPWHRIVVCVVEDAGLPNDASVRQLKDDGLDMIMPLRNLSSAFQGLLEGA